MKMFWSFTKGRRHTNSYPNQVTFNNQVSSSSEEIYKIFSEYFRTAYSNNETASAVVEMISDFPPEELNLLVVEPEEISVVIAKLDVNTHCGPDGIPNVLTKHASSSLTTPLSILFNKSLRAGVVPEAFKSSLRCS